MTSRTWCTDRCLVIAPTAADTSCSSFAGSEKGPVEAGPVAVGTVGEGPVEGSCEAGPPGAGSAAWEAVTARI
ncbi:hypothetical protein GCM10009853_034450 [Glycomyces scopariae]